MSTTLGDVDSHAIQEAIARGFLCMDQAFDTKEQ